MVQLSSGAIAAGCHHNGCAGKDWHALRDAVEPGWRDKSMKHSVARPDTSNGNPDEWPEPQPLPESLAPVMPFDYALLPEAFRPWINDIADRVQCPPDFPGIAAIVALAGVVGRKVGIRPKRYDDWIVVPNLWGAAVGRPGIMKTPAIAEPFKPVRQLEIEAKKRFDEEMKENKLVALVAEVRRKEAEGVIRKAIKNGDDAEAVAKQTIGDEAPLPIRRRYLINDSSVEKLGEILNQNPNGVIVYRDELVGLLRTLEKEGQESARAFYLEAWNGSGRFTYDRIGRGTIDIEAATLSVIGSVQPGPLMDYQRGAVENGSGDDGLLQRFQLIVYPDVSKAWVNVDRWPNSQARVRAFDVFSRLDNLNPRSVGAEYDQFEPDGIPYLHFDPPAQELFDTWRGELETKIRGGSEHPAVESHLAKYRSLIPSLALLIHLADDGTGSVGVIALKKAICWGEYLETHARRIFSVAANPDIAAARALASKIMTGRVTDSFALRDIYNNGWTCLGTRDDAGRAAALLLDSDWLVCIEEKTLGRPRLRYHINPRVYDIPASRGSKSSKSLGQVTSEGFAGSPESDSSGVNHGREVFEL